MKLAMLLLASTVAFGQVQTINDEAMPTARSKINANFSYLDLNKAPLASPTFTGALLFFPDNSFDIGASSASRPRNLYVAGNAFIGSTLVTQTGSPVGGTTHLQLKGNANLTFGLGLAGTMTGVSNTGGDFAIWRYDDTGAFLGQALSVTRSTGVMFIGGDFRFNTDNANDIGAVGASRPRNLYLAGAYVARGQSFVSNGSIPNAPGGLGGTLHVNQGGGNFGLVVTRTTADALFPHITLVKTRSSDPATPAAVLANDGLGDIEFWGYDSGAVARNAAKIAVTAATVNSSAVSGWMTFSTANTAGSIIDRWQITDAGHIYAALDNTFDLGATGANRPRDAYLGGTLKQISGVSTVANGVGAIVAKADATAQAANISTTTLYAVPAAGAGMYRVSCYVVLTQAATTSSTLPNCQVSFTDADTSAGVNGVPVGGLANPTGNTVGTTQFSSSASNSNAINAKASTNISYLTAGYASVGATPMQYALHIKLEYLGN